ILLIFDEVITGFGRLGHAFAAERYGVNPDMITFAKGITSGSVPMGGVIVRKGIYDAFMRGPMHVAELFHGYTYSAHPLACAAGLATLDLYREENLFERAHKLEPVWAEAAMSLKGLPNVLDIRCVGLTAGIDLASPIAVDEHPRLLPRVMGDIAAVPHGADDVGQRPPRGGAKAPREFVGEPIAGIEDRAVTMVDRRQDGIAGGKGDCEQREYARPHSHDAPEPHRLDRGASVEHDPKPEEQPQGIAPHRDGAASGERRKRD